MFRSIPARMVPCVWTFTFQINGCHLEWSKRRWLSPRHHRGSQGQIPRQPVFRRQASPSKSGPELNSPSRDMGFFRAGTEPARSALHFPDPRLFAIATSLHLNSFVVLRGSILQLTFHFSFVA